MEILNMTHEAVNELHNQKLNNAENLSEYTIKIVNIIGGIDTILTDYLTKSQLISSINQNKLQRIHQIMSTPKHVKFGQKNQPIPTTTTNTIITQNYDNPEEIAPLLILDENDIWLYSLFSRHIADKLYLFVWHKIPIISLCIAAIFGFLSYLMFPTSKVILYFNIIGQLTWITWLSLIILSANRVASKLIMTSFVFLLKFYYATVYSASVIVYNIVRHDNDSSTGDKILLLLGYSVSIPFFLLLIVFMFNLDAYKINKFTKIAIPGITAVIFFVLWLQLALFMYSNDKQDPSLITISNDIHISLLAQQEGAALIISIFGFKQAFMTWYRERDKNENKKAITIKVVARKKWNTITPIAKEMAQYQENNIAIEIGSTNSRILTSSTDTIQTEEIKIENIAKLKRSKQDRYSASISKLQD